MANLFELPRYIAVEGPIRVGKSTLAGILAERLNAQRVIFSLQAFQKNHPTLSAYYRHVVRAEQTGDREATFTFDSPGNRELPQIVGQLTVLPKHWWEGADASGKKRDVSATTLEPPLGCGAYRIKEFVAGRTIRGGR